jgi:GNAT superfamily N-acetyltransferase
MWRRARPDDDDRIVAMCSELYSEDPGQKPVPPEHARNTLSFLRREPSRGHALVLEVDGASVGYAILIAFWSNELGGDVCEIDELFVAPQHRSRGHGAALFRGIESGDLWGRPRVALALLTTPDNARARKLYERVGFSPIGISLVRRFDS